MSIDHTVRFPTIDRRICVYHSGDPANPPQEGAVWIRPALLDALARVAAGGYASLASSDERFEQWGERRWPTVDHRPAHYGDVFIDAVIAGNNHEIRACYPTRLGNILASVAGL